MPYISDELKEQILSSTDVVDVISDYVNLTRKGANYWGLCPFHGEKTPSFSVSSAKQIYYCFGCHKGGDSVRFLMEYDNMSFPEAMAHLAAKAGIEIPESEERPRDRKLADKKTRLFEIQKQAAAFYYRQLRQPGGETGMRYFEKRQLTPELMHRFGLGYAPKAMDALYRHLKEQGFSDAELKDSGLVQFDEKRGAHDKFFNRVMFPIMNANNKVIAFGGRVLGDGEPKYLNSPETPIFEKSRNLYGLHLARKRAGRFSHSTTQRTTVPTL